MRIAVILSFFLISFFGRLEAQWISVGSTFGIDFYQFYQNPDTHPLGDFRSGSAVANLNWGPKLWLGSGKVNASLEAQVSYAPFAFDINDYKGLGAVSFPFIASLNFNGVSTTAPQPGTGFSVGGGFVLVNSELYFLSDEYKAIEYEDRTQYFPAYFGQIGIGFGAIGFSGILYGRYGQGPDGAAVMSVGFMINVNKTAPKKDFSLNNDS